MSRFPELTRVTVSALRPLRSVSLREPKRRKLRPCFRLTFPVTAPLVEEVKRRVTLPRPVAVAIRPITPAIRFPAL